MREMTYVEALNEAFMEEMARDDTVVVYGEDAEVSFTFQATKGLLERFGPERVRDTPICENLLVGAGVGAAIGGLRPVVDMTFCDFLPLAMDQIVNQAAKARYMSGGQVRVPLVINAAIGHLGSWAAHHSQCLQALFAHVPGLRVVLPSTPYDVKGLMKTAIRCDDPVVFLEHKLLFKTKGEVPDGEYTIPFGRADVKRMGRHVTIVAISYMVLEALKAAEALSAEGIEACVIDPRTLAPLDHATIIDSIKETGRLVVVDEAAKSFGAGAEIVARVCESAFDCLDAPVQRIGVPDVPIPQSGPLEREVIPNVQSIVAAVKRVC
jgi:acetoin:2,6-dichlorophenolindophenol oxidoreductase subunit beta